MIEPGSLTQTLRKIRRRLAEIGLLWPSQRRDDRKRRGADLPVSRTAGLALLVLVPVVLLLTIAALIGVAFFSDTWASQ